MTGQGLVTAAAVKVALALAMQAALMQTASAQWQGAAGAGMRSAIHSEYDEGGHRLVRESGWLPGAALTAAYRAGDFTWSSTGEFYRGDIGYQGQTQAGVQASSTTSSALAVVRVGGAYAVNERYSLLAALEWQQWKRDILGAQGAAGLQEQYRSKRLIAGARRTWNGTVSVDGALVLSAAERLQVGFSGLLDPASLDMRRSLGIRLGAAVRPAFAPYLELRAGYDRTRIPRSGDAAVTRAGQFAGTIAQPELRKQAVTLTVSYVFPS